MRLHAGGLFFFNHKKRAGCDEYDTDRFRQRNALTQKHKSQNNRQDRARLINRHHLINVSDLQRPKIAQPRGAGCQTGQHEK